MNTRCSTASKPCVQPYAGDPVVMSFLQTIEHYANVGHSMCEVIFARIEKSVAGVSSCDEILAEVAGCL